MEGKEAKRPAVSAWALTEEELFKQFNTSVQGLSDGEVVVRQKMYGPNEFVKHGKARVLALIARQFMSPLVFMLIAAAGITVLLREYTETVVILLAVCVNAALGFFQEYKAENTLDKLTAYIKERTRVVRDGKEREIDSAELVPGDVVVLQLGSRVPADIRLLFVSNFSVDESFLTGESMPIEKNIEVVSEGAPVTERTNSTFAGSLVVEGFARGVVMQIGESTEIGRIADLVSNVRSEETPLQKSLSKLAWVIFAGALVIVAGIFFLGLSRGEPILEMLLLSVAVAVGAIPEALPIALTVILAVGVERIASRRGIVRSLSAAETLGSTTLVMTDKTGTLTEAKMQITGIYTAQSMHGKQGSTGIMDLSQIQKDILSYAFLCTETVVENAEEEKSQWRFIGRPLERNIGSVALTSGIDVLAVARRREVVLPFNSTNKFSVAYDAKSKNYYVLGAPDILLERSQISKDAYLAMELFVQTISAEGKRLIGIAKLLNSALSKGKHAVTASDVEELEFLGTLVLYDPVRKGAKEAVLRIEEHGARVVMLTGDLKGTAMAIGLELGWEISEGNVITGNELRQLSDDELQAQLSHIKIFARVTPEDKLRIGKLFQKSGEVVAMTGDGVNDAPSLKAVDIGIALGSGSDVAKSVADLVLLDDDFKTIVLAIEEGRRIIANIRKAFVYLMSNCLDEVFLIGGSLIFGLSLPLTAIQIIWVNFFTGSLPALSFAFEKNKDLKHSSGKGEIFNTEVRVLTIGIGMITSLLLFILYFGLLRFGVELALAQTMLFLCFASYILAVAFSFKDLQRPLFSYDLFDNRALNISILIAALLLFISVAIPELRSLLDLIVPSPPWILFIILWLVFNVTLVEASKWIFRRFQI